MAVLPVLLAVLIVRLWVEAKMAGDDPYCYWDASFPSRSLDVYGQYTLSTITCTGTFQDQAHNIQDISCLFPAGLAPWA